MPTETLTFDSPERLRQILNVLFDEFSARIIQIRISKGTVVAEFDKEVEFLGYGSDDLWEQARASKVITYDYAGPFSLAVMQEIFRIIKIEGLVPSHILIHPESSLKKTREWRDLSVVTLTEATYLGLRVVETEAIDEGDFLVAASHSPSANAHNVIMGVKGQINESP
jgi:hypothetical protein